VIARLRRLAVSKANAPSNRPGTSTPSRDAEPTAQLQPEEPPSPGMDVEPPVPLFPP
jgi:hypothetical protein